VPEEGVVDALRRAETVLVTGGWLIDLRPERGEADVESDDGPLGRVDGSRFDASLNAVDRAIRSEIELGRLHAVTRHSFVLGHQFETVADFFSEVGAWRGTVIPPDVGERVRAARAPIRVRRYAALQELRKLAP
jgi:hypothetical protein